MNRYTAMAVVLLILSFFGNEKEEVAFMGAAISFSILGIFNAWDRFNQGKKPDSLKSDSDFIKERGTAEYIRRIHTKQAAKQLKKGGND